MNQRGFQPTHTGLLGSPASNWTQTSEAPMRRPRQGKALQPPPPEVANRARLQATNAAFKRVQAERHPRA
jgi:hypothetical protein